MNKETETIFHSPCKHCTKKYTGFVMNSVCTNRNYWLLFVVWSFFFSKLGLHNTFTLDPALQQAYEG